MNGKQLKNSILQWAIQGKLVPQDPHDEPASVLLEKIRKEKERLIKEKKIKRNKNASIIYRGDDNSYYEKILATGEVTCIDEEVPFEIPKGWEWCRIRDLYDFIDYRGATPHKLSKGIPLITAKNVKQGYLDYTIKDFISSEEYSNRLSRGVSHKGDILFTTEAPLGNVAIADLDVYSTGQRLITLQAYIPCYTNNDMFMFFMLSPLFQESVISYKTGTTVAGIKASKLKEVLIPTPPISEQFHIVKKIRTLLPFIEKYSSSQALLNKSNSEIKDKLGKSILQEAIQGKLVPQIVGEGTAQELLEQIKVEKLKLVKEGKLKKSALNDSVIFRGDDNKYYEQVGKELVDITEEIPFDLPCNWCWCRFSNIVSMTIGKTPARGEQTYWINGKYNWVSISDMVDGGTIYTTKEKVSDLAVKEIFSAPISEKGSLLMSFKLSIGKTSILNIDAYHNEAIITIRPVIDKEYAMRNYLFKVLPQIANSGESKDAIKGKTLNSKSLGNLLIPLPPLVEQRRIVQKIEQLMQLFK